MRNALQATLATAALLLLWACGGSSELANHRIPTDAATGSSVFVVEFTGL